MAKYRFKTEEEFRKDRLWDPETGAPIRWNSDREMNRYMGQDVPEKYNDDCDALCELTHYYDEAYGQYWIFRECDYVYVGDTISGIQYDIY